MPDKDDLVRTLEEAGKAIKKLTAQAKKGNFKDGLEGPSVKVKHVEIPKKKIYANVEFDPKSARRRVTITLPAISEA